jgi:hypothetical protein
MKTIRLTGDFELTRNLVCQRCNATTGILCNIGEKVFCVSCLLNQYEKQNNRISQLEADAQLSEKAMRAALALLDTSLETGDGYALPLIELVRVRNLLKSALRI